VVKIGGLSLGLIFAVIFILGSLSVLSNSPPIFGVRTDEGFVPLKGEVQPDDIVQFNKNKLNTKTEEYLETAINRSEEKLYIVKFKNEIKTNKLNKVNVGKEYAAFKAARIQTDYDNIVELLNDSDVEYVELDQEVSLLEDSIPYGITAVQAPSVWNSSKGDGVKIAVLDSGIAQHTDLQIAGGYAVVSQDYADTFGHGTSVAGVISALLNEEGIVGAAPEASIYAVKIMNTSLGDLSDAIAGLQWAIDNDVDIVSMSFGFNDYSQIFKEAVEEAYNNGIISIGSSGNNGGAVVYPAAYTEVIAVGAVDSSNQKASFSSYGPELELVAPGVDIQSTALGNGYDSYSGTSMSAPHVAGVAALIKAHNTSLTNVQIRGKLQNDALDLGFSGKDDEYGFGLVQANLESQEYNTTQESYFYEIFNIWNYNTPEEEIVFWLNGTGTIDDVIFTEGYYLVKKYLGEEVIEIKLQVKEDGTVLLLWTLRLYDDFTKDSTSDDGNVWVNGNLTTVYIDPYPPYLEGECYDYDDDNIFEECYYKDSTAKSQCEAYSQTLAQSYPFGKTFYNYCALGQGPCLQGTEQNHSIDTSAPKDSAVALYLYVDCDNSEGRRSDSGRQEDYYTIYDRKWAVCQTASTYYLRGRYDSTYPTAPSTENYNTTFTCPAGTVCNSGLDEQWVAAQNGTIPNPCVSGSDLYINEEDIQVLKQGSQTNFTVTVHALNVNRSNVVITFYGLVNGIDIQRTSKTLSFVPSDSSAVVSAVMTVNFDDMRIMVDSTNLVTETDETNNYPEVSATKIRAYLNISTGYPLVDTKIETFLKKHIDSVSETDTNFTIAVGDPVKNSFVNEHNDYTLMSLRWWYDKRQKKVSYNGVLGKEPYNAIVGSFYDPLDKKTRIFIYGNELEGTISGVKRLIDEKDKFFKNLAKSKETYLEKYDVEAYSIWDYLRNTNNADYPYDGTDFPNFVEYIFNNELFEEELYYVKEPGQNTALRLKHIGPVYTDALKNASGKNPVILSRGIHSNLFTWEDSFGRDLAEKDRKDVWLIEMVGGPNQDENCGDNCPNYTFTDLKDNYWPALIAGVQYYSGSANASYVGYSLGCSAALESLESYNAAGKPNAATLLEGTSINLAANPMDTFVAVACPGNFSKLTIFLDAFNATWESINNSYNWQNLQHITTDQLKRSVLSRKPILLSHDIKENILINVLAYIIPFGDNRMSKSIYDSFYEWANDGVGPKIGENVQINNFAIIEGKVTNAGVGLLLIPPAANAEDTDLVVTTSDQKEICQNVVSSNKNYLSFENKLHMGPFKLSLGESPVVQKVIKEFLANNQLITQKYINDYVISTQQDCER